VAVAAAEADRVHLFSGPLAGDRGRVPTWPINAR